MCTVTIFNAKQPNFHQLWLILAECTCLSFPICKREAVVMFLWATLHRAHESVLIVLPRPEILEVSHMYLPGTYPGPRSCRKLSHEGKTLSKHTHLHLQFPLSSELPAIPPPANMWVRIFWLKALLFGWGKYLELTNFLQNRNVSKDSCLPSLDHHLSYTCNWSLA